MAYADVSVSNAESRQTKIPIALNYDLAFNVGGTQDAGQKTAFDAGSDTSTPKAVSAQGGPAALNDASPINTGAGLSGGNGGDNTTLWVVIGGFALLLVVLIFRR